MYRPAYSVTTLKKVDGNIHQRENTNNSNVLPFNVVSLPKIVAGTQNLLPGLVDFEYSGPKEILNGMICGASDSEFVQKITKTFMKGGEEKGVNYVYPVGWIKPKGEKQENNIMINAEIFIGPLFIQTKEISLYFRDPLKQEQILLYKGEKVESDSVQYILDQNTKPNMFTIVIFLNSTSAKIVNAVKQYVFGQQVRRKNNFSSLGKSKTKQVDDFQLFETNDTNLY